MTQPPKPLGRLTPPPGDARAIDLPEDGDEPLELVEVADWQARLSFDSFEPASARRPLALVADDDAGTRRLLREVLGEMGCDVVEAADGAVAVQRARERAPDVAVVDAMMPAVHGFEVCRALKADPALAGTRVLLCSAAYRGGAVEDARARYGADAAIEKPFRLDELRRAVSALLPQAPREPPGRAEADRAWRAASEALAAGQPGEAVRHAQAAVAADAGCAEAHYYLGHALVRAGSALQAVASFEAACALRPDLPLLHESLAELLERLEFHRAARAAWMRAAESCAEPAQRKAYGERLMRLLQG